MTFKMDSVDVEERKKMFELTKDRELGGNMDWMYRGDKPDTEEFLLGKSIDKLVAEATTNEGSGSIFSERVKANVAMDMAAKMREDPLFAIKKKEEEARKHLLENPVKMKQLEKLVEQQRQMKLKAAKKKEKKDKKKKQKKSKRSNSSSNSCESEDDLVNQYLTILTQKKKSYTDIEHTRSAHDGRVKKNDQKNNSERDLHDLRNYRDRNSRDFNSRDFSVSSDSRQRHNCNHINVELRKDKGHRSHSPQHSHIKSGESRDDGRKRSFFSPGCRHPQIINSETDTHQPHRHDSSDEGETMPNRVYGLIKHHRHSIGELNMAEKSQKAKRSRKSSSSSSSSRSRSSKRLSHSKDKKHLEKRHQKPQKKRSSSESSSRSPIRKRDTTTQKKHKSRSKSAGRQKSLKTLPKKRLTEEEKAQKVQEMMDNAKWRDEQRKQTVERYRKEKDNENSCLKTYQREAGFLNSIMSEHVGNSSVEDRLKRNRYNIQRTRAALDKNFTQH